MNSCLRFRHIDNCDWIVHQIDGSVITMGGIQQLSSTTLRVHWTTWKCISLAWKGEGDKATLREVHLLVYLQF
jgi:hypothetical protein